MTVLYKDLQILSISVNKPDIPVIPVFLFKKA